MTPVILIVLDGFGVTSAGPGNPVSQANIPNLYSYLRIYPTTQLKASGESVGLPASEPGNTEVGHLNMGAGRVVYQSLPRINMAIGDGSFYKNDVFLKGITTAKKNNSDMHIIGLVGAGTVHASMDHLFSLIKLCKDQGVTNLFIHPITDGRDSPPQSSETFLKQIDQKCQEYKIGTIATIMGRYYAIDRDKRWDRIEKAYIALTEGGVKTAQNWQEALKNSYDENITDEFIVPTNIVKNDKPVALIKENDVVIFYNYRIDRPRELTRAFTLDDFEKEANKITSYDPYATKYLKKNTNTNDQIIQSPFKRKEKIKNLMFITMTEYERDLPVEIAFPPHIVAMPLGRVLGERQINQLRVTESEKERFVTFYFNGLREAPFPLESHLIVPSPKVPMYNQKPEMSAHEITDILVNKIAENKYSFILTNYANPDMVGHTGDLKACITAIEVVDECLGKVVKTAQDHGYVVLITADHGNVEEKLNKNTGQISTEHTNNPVPFIAISEKFKGKPIRLQQGILADIAPTILAILGISVPHDMMGRNLLEEVL